MGKPVWCIFLRSLPTGGVERQFTLLAKLLSRDRRVLLVTLFAQGNDSFGLPDAVERRALFDMPDGGNTPLSVLLRAPGRLRKLCRKEGVTVVYSAREVANLVAALGIGKRKNLRLLWGHRVSTHQFSARIRALLPLCRRVQSRVDCQIANSADGIEFYKSIGLCEGRVEQVANFLDAELFKPSPQLREEQRRAWNLDDGEIAVGIVGRIAPMKNYEGFLRAVSRIANAVPRLRVFMVCPEDPEGREWLAGRVRHHGLGDRAGIYSACGEDGMVRVYNGLDALCSTSLFGEGFSNALTEAMGCGCPVVATDVGEATRITGGLCPVVPAGDDEAFSEALFGLLERGPAGSAAERRAHILRVCDETRILDRITGIGEGAG